MASFFRQFNAIDPLFGMFWGNMKKIKGDPWEIFKISEKKIKMRFLNSVTVPKNVKGGTLWDFLTSIVLQNIFKNEGETLWWNPKSFKKSRIVPKKIRVKNTKGSYVIEVLDVDVFVLDEVLAVRVCFGGL